jgi:uncharacterized membrane protein
MCVARRRGRSTGAGGKDTGPAGGGLSQTETGRVEAFSDGVLAIAITLLVLNLRPPDHVPGQLLAGLLRQWPAYLGYVTSFLYIAVIWLNHHQTFARIRTVDRGLHFANIAVLFTVALLPFPTAVLADAIREANRADTNTAVALYALVAALMCASWWWLFSHLQRHPDLVHDQYARYFPQGRLRAAVGVVGYAAGGALGDLIDPVAALAFVPAAARVLRSHHGGPAATRPAP